MDHLENELVKWNDRDTKTLAFGLKRTVLALLTAAMFALSVLGFIKVASATGYIAVLVFFGSVIALLTSFVLLYAQGVTGAESKGESK